MYRVIVRMHKEFLNGDDWFAAQETFDSMFDALIYAFGYSLNLYSVRVEVWA